MKKIVIVDDDPEMRDLIAEILRPHFAIATAEDGVFGLEAVRRERPDLVILDLLMPRMHGFEVCQRIRQDPDLKGTKVLISTSKSYSHDSETARTAGADSYIVKPFAIADLTERVESLIGGSKSSLRLRFWGTRGSIPTPGPATARYGGNTACVELRVGEQLIIIDAGSGIRELGDSLMRESAGKKVEGHLFIGHAHYDHIQGLPFFTPAYLPQNRFSIYGVHGTTKGFSEVLSGQMTEPYFPVTMKQMMSNPAIHELSGPTQLGDVKITYHYLNHPGITIGFRIETKDCTIGYISDHEPYGRLNNKGEFSQKEDDAVAQFVWGCDVLISEAQYTDDEYKMRRTWGHSTFSDVVALAAKAQVKQLALTHHDPAHTDAMMDRFVAECQEVIKRQEQPMTCFAAQEGLTLNL